MIAKLLSANTRYLALVILAILVVGYTSMSGMARKEDPAITPGFAKIQIFFQFMFKEEIDIRIALN